MFKKKPYLVRFFITLLITGLLASLFLIPSAASTQNLTFIPVADAYVDPSQPTSTFGSATTLRVDGSPIVNSYMRFSVLGVGGQTISQVRLLIHANSGSSQGLVAKSVANNTWGESTLNYSNAPATGSTLATSVAVTSGIWVTLDVTSFVTGDGTYSFGVSTPGATAISLSSRESGASAPQLIVTINSFATPTATIPGVTNIPTATSPVATNTPTVINPAATNTPTATHAVATSTPTIILGQSLTFIPVADSYVDSSQPSANFGSATTLRVDASPSVNSYLRFSVLGASGQSISRVRLLVHANSKSTRGLVVRSVADNTWGEGTLKYSNAPAIGNSLAVSAAVKSGTWVTLDVTGYVTGNGTFSFGISTPGSTAITLAARESGANAPQLIIDLGGTFTPTPTNTSTSSPTNTPVNTPTDPPANTATATPASTPVSTPLGSTIKHVFVVVMENHSYAEVWNTSSSPYITSLGNAYARTTNYFAIAHPSLPNYLDLFGGSNYGITTDCNPSSTCHVTATNLADNLEAAGLTWKGYMESMSAACTLTLSDNYAPKHDPFIYFDDILSNTARCNAGVVPYTALATDLVSNSTTPNYAFITPDLCSDMHDCPVSTGDTWLSNNLPAILTSPACTLDTCLLILTWDEGGSLGNQVLTIFAGSGAQTGGVASSVAYTHFSMLRTVEDIFGLPTQTGNDAAASPMTDLLR